MPPSLIKRRGGARVPQLTRPGGAQRGFTSLCLASLNHGRVALGRSTNEAFDADHATRFFFAGEREAWRAGLPPLGAQGQAVEIFVEMT